MRDLYFLWTSFPACHIMAEGLAPFYRLQNSELSANCTITALFPAVVSVLGLKVSRNTDLTDQVGIQFFFPLLNLFKIIVVCPCTHIFITSTATKK